MHANFTALNPNIDGIIRIEKMLETSVLTLAKKLADGELLLEELVIIIENSLETKLGAGEIHALLLEQGISKATESVTALFIRLLKGG